MSLRAKAWIRIRFHILTETAYAALSSIPIYGGGNQVGSVVKKRRKRMAKKKHKKLLKKTRIQRRNKK